MALTWRVGLSTGACIDRPVGEVLEAFHAIGVRGVELGSRRDHFDTANADAVAAIAARLRAMDVEPVSIHAPFGGAADLSSVDAERRASAIEAVLQSASALKHLGGHIVVVHPTDVPRATHDVTARLDAAVDGLRAVADRCRQEGLTLAVESPLPHLIGGHPDEFRSVLQRLPPDVRVCLDTGHTFLGGFWDQFIAVAGERLAHVHANDTRGTFDDHLIPGDGRIHWPHIVETLRQARFTGWVMLELHCPAGELGPFFAGAMSRASILRAPE